MIAAIRLCLIAVLWVWAAPVALAKGGEVVFPAPQSEGARLTIWATIDLDAAQPLIHGYQKENPHVAVLYREMETLRLYEDSLAGGDGRPDLTISSAMDLQVKFVNDGHSRPYVSEATQRLPAWANWRNEAFAITLEPAVIVYNAQLGDPALLPRTRAALAQMLTTHSAELKGRVATYNIAESGIGYLLATHDTLHAGNISTLLRSLGQVEVRLHCCTSNILAGIERGEILIGYNLLGSYAATRQRRGAPIRIVRPEDFTLVISRVAVIPRTAKQPRLAGEFIDYVLSPEGRERLATEGLHETSITSYVNSAASVAVEGETSTAIQPVAIGPSLLVFLDRLKQRKFIQTWYESLGRSPN